MRIHPNCDLKTKSRACYRLITMIKAREYRLKIKQDPIEYERQSQLRRIRDKRRRERIQNDPTLLQQRKDYQNNYRKTPKRMAQINEYNREYIKQDYVKERRKPIKKKYEKGLRVKAFDKLGGRCFQCGIDDLRVIQFHHSLINGHKEKTPVMYRRILKGDKDVVILCANCHIIWHREDKERKLTLKEEWVLTKWLK